MKNFKEDQAKIIDSYLSTVTAPGMTLKFNEEKTELSQSAGEDFLCFDIVYDHREAQ